MSRHRGQMKQERIKVLMVMLSDLGYMSGTAVACGRRFDCPKRSPERVANSWNFLLLRRVPARAGSVLVYSRTQ